MSFRKGLHAGIIAGLVMGMALFINGAITARIIYGPQMVPEGKFNPEQINAWYFFWTKLVIGCFFGVFFTLIYLKLTRYIGVGSTLRGAGYGFLLWLIILLWNISHPLVYESIVNKNQLFWNIYTLGGFLTYGVVVGFIFKKWATGGKA